MHFEYLALLHLQQIFKSTLDYTQLHMTSAVGQTLKQGIMEANIINPDSTAPLGAVLSGFIWALTRKNLSSGGCEQYRRRPAAPLLFPYR